MTKSPVISTFVFSFRTMFVISNEVRNPIPPCHFDRTPVISNEVRNLIRPCHFERSEKSYLPLSFRPSFCRFERSEKSYPPLSFRPHHCHFERSEKSCTPLSFRPTGEILITIIKISQSLALLRNDKNTCHFDRTTVISNEVRNLIRPCHFERSEKS